MASEDRAPPANEHFSAIEWLQHRVAAENCWRLESATDTQIRPGISVCPADAQLLAGAQREAMADFDALIVAKGVKRSAKDYTAHVGFRSQPWPLEREFQRRRIGGIADQRVAQHQRAAVRCAADGNA